MEARNIKRYFLGKKAIRTYNRRTGYSLTHGQANILFAVYFLTLQSQTVSKTFIHQFLQATSNHTAFSEVTRGVDKLTELGLLIRLAIGKINRYHLSATGKNEVMAMEQLLREQRCDKFSC